MTETTIARLFKEQVKPVLGCTEPSAITKAGLAASAGLTYLLGGDIARIENAMKIFAADITGVICDGAKPSCSLKLATSASSALQSALFSLRGMTIGGTQGIIRNNLNLTLKNIAKF